MKGKLSTVIRYFAGSQLEANGIVDEARKQFGNSVKAVNVVKKSKKIEGEEVEYFVVAIAIEFAKPVDYLV